MIKKTFNLKKLVRTMPDLFKNFVNVHGAGINDAIQNGIDLGVDIHGKPFKQMSAVTEAMRSARRTGNKLLDESGEMRKTKLEKATNENLTFSITNIGKSSDGVYYGTFIIQVRVGLKENGLESLKKVSLEAQITIKEKRFYLE